MIKLPCVVILCLAMSASAQQPTNPADSMEAEGPATARPSEPTTATQEPIRIEYEVLGPRGQTADLTYENETGDTEQLSNVRLPWTLDLRVQPGFFAYVSAQLNGKAGEITASVNRDLRPLKTATSNGQYVIASASASVK